MVGTVAPILVGTCGYQRYDPGEGWQEEYESKPDELADVLRAYGASHDRVYCMFTNYEMHANARALRDRL